MTTASDLQQRFTGKYLLTGMLTMSAIQEQARPDSAFNILDVQPMVDDNGDVLPRFKVTMPFGTYTVAIIDEDTIEEEP